MVVKYEVNKVSEYINYSLSMKQYSETVKKKKKQSTFLCDNIENVQDAILCEKHKVPISVFSVIPIV